MPIGKTLLSRYKILKQIGAGGFGHTYLATDLAYPGNPDRLVKHLSPKNTTPEILELAKKLFQREAECLSRLGQHDRIPTLYAYFEEERQFYLVQEFIDGHELTQEIQTGQPWNEERTFVLVREILEILNFVHQQKVIHRDIKPSNIMRRKQDGKIVLIDFGIVKEIMNLSPQGKMDTTLGLGTPTYMPWEQWNGNPQLASDIYAVGILGIQALTGVKPDRLAIDKENQNIQWRDRDRVSDSFANILDKMVCHDFHQRYQNAAEALQTIDLLQNKSEPLVDKAPPDTTVKSLKPKKRQQLWLSLGAIALIGSGIAFFTLFDRVNYSELEKDLAAQQWQIADLETDRILDRVAGG